MPGKGGSWWFYIFLRWSARKEGPIFLGECYIHRNYGMVIILLSFLCNYDNLIPKLHQEKDEGWLFICRFKIGSVPGISVVLVACKKVSKSIMSMMQGY